MNAFVGKKIKQHLEENGRLLHVVCPQAHSHIVPNAICAHQLRMLKSRLGNEALLNEIECIIISQCDSSRTFRLDYLQIGLDLKWVDIGCDGSTWNAKKQVSLNTNFTALIERLKHTNDWKATENFPCSKERKFVDPGDNDEFRMVASKRVYNCRETCAELHRSVCLGKFIPGPLK